MKANIIMNFTDVYREESFYQHEKFKWIDCKDIKGTNCICDNEAEKEIRQCIALYPPEGLHFIDSGNYHYISKFWTDKIKMEFVLVVFDHHPDMQPSIVEGVITCGNWVKTAIDSNPHLKRVIMIGVKDRLLKTIEEKYKKLLTIFSESALQQIQDENNFTNIDIKEPVYISVDKDILSEKDELLNWDQGTTHISGLKKALAFILRQSELIGIDICGECSYTIAGLIDPNLRKDNEINAQLLHFFERE